MIHFEFEPGYERVVEGMLRAPERVEESVYRTMLKIVIRLQRHVVMNKLQGQVLHHRTGHLQHSVTFKVDRETGEVTGIVGVGKEAPYGKVHEYGGTFEIPEHLAHWVKGPGHGRTAHLASWTVRSHSATFPARSFLRTSLDDERPQIFEDLQHAVVEPLK